MHSFPVEYSKKWEKIKAVPDPLASAEQLASAMSSTMFQDQAFEVKAEPSQMVKVEMNCDDDDEEARELEEALRNPIMIRQSATEEAPFYKCKVCSQLLPCSNNEADTERIDKHLKNHKMEKVEQKKKYEQMQRMCPIKRKESNKISRKKYYEQNKDKIKLKNKENSKKYYEQNKDKMKQKIKENNKKYYEQNKMKLKQKIKEEDQQFIDDTEDEDDQKDGNEVGEFDWEYEDEKVKDELVDPKLMDDSKSKSTYEAILSGYNNITRSFQCNLCNKLMPCKSEEDKKKIQSHLNSHRKRQREMDEKNDTRDLSELICQICYKKAKSWKGNGLVTDLERHMMVHHEGPKICKHCRKTDFSSDKQWTDHELWCYSNSVPVECKDCGEKLANRNLLVTHRDTLHRGPYICDTCGKEFRTVRNLTNHRRIHLGTEFACEVQDCGQKFTTRDMLKEHVNHVHLNIRPFECETCSRSFKSKVMLKSHQKIHSEVLGYICPYCGKGFKQSSVLYRHKLSCPMNMGNV